MKLTQITLCIFFFITVGNVSAFAQNDYIITLAGDTLKGKVSRGNLISNSVALRNNNGRQKFRLREIKEWKNGKAQVLIWKDTTRKREVFHELALETDGKIKLLWDYQVEMSSSYVIYIDGQYMSPTPSNITNHVWQKLLRCRPFYTKYHKYSKEEAGLLFSNKKVNGLKEIINYYNSNCDRIFEYKISTTSNETNPLPAKIKYIYRNQYLVREVTKRYDSISPHNYRTETDSISFSLEKYDKLKAYCIKNWQNYREEIYCKHLSPLSATLHFENNQTNIYAGYYPCRSKTLPKDFVAMQRFLEDYFEPNKRILPTFELTDN